MKKYLFLFLLCVFSLNANDIEGNIDKGFTYYKYVVKPIIKIKGSDFTHKFLADEWRELFKNDAQGFKKEFSPINSEFSHFLESKKFKKIAPHLEAFFVHYAKDSGHSPHCGTDDID